ncbi:hypothetical protein [Aquimarina spongiae]|uniref:Secreted protein n=1 Tax=Aquimarina spongiae TaxID=570521 RepID=A0A1M6DAN3_9FLAO|nr:hypothetical protein [Aquimarina spongiae]SHI70209.1 hypothetical protein SAMN04488508_102517 [Aquimarina spongiae]
MKTIKTLFAILFLSTFFIACEADSVNDEVGLESDQEVFLVEDDSQEVSPGQ